MTVNARTKPAPPPGQDLLGPAWGKDPAQPLLDGGEGGESDLSHATVLVNNPALSPTGLSFTAQ